MTERTPIVVIAGGGLGGPAEVILIDRNNHHLFQPLLYQVATSVLSPAQIASPIREIVRKQRNRIVLMAEVVRFDSAYAKTRLNESESHRSKAWLECSKANGRCSPSADSSREEMLQAPMAGNPEVTPAAEKVVQAKAALASAKSAYIPDISIFARQSYQNGVPFLVHNFGTFGATLSYDVFDFGKRRAEVREREAQLEEAQENVARWKDEVSVENEQGYNKVERTKW